MEQNHFIINGKHRITTHLSKEEMFYREGVSTVEKDDGPNYEEPAGFSEAFIGHNKDSSGRREARANYELVKQKALLVKDENVPFGVKEQETKDPTEDRVFAALLAAMKIVNVNLLCIDARQKRYPQIHIDQSTLKRRDQFLMQSEAQAIFKGNFIRLLKNVFGSSEINRIKKSTSFTVNIGTTDGYPEVSWVLFFWDDYKYVSTAAEVMKRFLNKAFNKLDTMITHQVWKEAFLAWKDKMKNEPLPKIPVTDISQVNFDSIKAIKF